MEHVSEKWGNLSMILECKGCDWTGLIRYSRRQPEYCSNACKQRAYRKRRRDAKNATAEADLPVTNLSRPRIEREIDQALFILRCDCRRAIWTVRGNVQAGGLYCTKCNSAFH